MTCRGLIGMVSKSLPDWFDNAYRTIVLSLRCSCAGSMRGDSTVHRLLGIEEATEERTLETVLDRSNGVLPSLNTTRSQSLCLKQWDPS
jgi:hypothetical protein